MKKTLLFFVGMLVGSSLIFITLTATPRMCRAVVLKDLTESVAYNQELSRVLPDPQGSDFLTAMARGRK